jgi:hypothetical protein
MNQRGFSTLQIPNFNYTQAANTKSILKKGGQATPLAIKSIKFDESAVVNPVSPMPEGYYGEYVQISRNDRRWAGNAS